MKVKQVRIAVGRTINMGNYESLRVEMESTVDLETGDKSDQVLEDTFEHLKTKVRKKTTAEEVKKWKY